MNQPKLRLSVRFYSYNQDLGNPREGQTLLQTFLYWQQWWGPTMLLESILCFVKCFHIHHFILGVLTFHFIHSFTKYLLSICPMPGTVQGVLHMLPPNMTSPVYFTTSPWQRYHCYFTYEETMALSLEIQRWRTPCPCSLEQRSANFACKGTDSKYFRLCGPYSLLQLLNSAITEKNSHRIQKWMRATAFQQSFVYKNRWWDRFCLWAIVRYACPTGSQSRGETNANSPWWDDVVKRIYKGLGRQSV